MELWDLYNERRELTGRDHIRGEEVPQGFYHLVVHIWIRNSKGEYMDGKVVGRIDSTKICSYFDGSTKAYLDWICVIKSYRHKGVAQALMTALRKELKAQGVDTLIGLIASNEDAQRFYRNLPNSEIRDKGIWIDL